MRYRKTKISDNFSVKWRDYKDYVCFDPKDEKTYKNFMKKVLNLCDSVCFTVMSGVDSLEELVDTELEFMCYTCLFFGYGSGVNDGTYNIHQLLVVKNSYDLYEFFLRKKDIFDFDYLDKEMTIKLENPEFIKDGEVLCHTVTHEEICIVLKDMVKEIT